MISLHCYRVWRTTTAAATIAVAINGSKTRPDERKTAKNRGRERRREKINRKRKLIILRVHFDIFLYVLVSSALISFIQSLCKVEAIFLNADFKSFIYFFSK